MKKLILLVAAFYFIQLQSEAQTSGEPGLQETTKGVVTSLSDSILRIYVDKEKAGLINENLLKNLKAGKYAKIETLEKLANQLTVDLVEVSNDKHFAVVPPTSGKSGPMRMRLPGADYSQFAYDNFFFKKIEILPGNVAYLEINQFIPLKFSSPLIISAMTFVSNADALIIDLRKCVGGDPNTVAQLAGFFFESQTLLNTMEIRERNQRFESWTSKTSFSGLETFKDEKGNLNERRVTNDYSKLTKIPLYILTSNFSFSAAELFCYSLQARGRAVITGEVTGGGGHGIRSVALAHGFRVMLPFVRPINPVTNSGWEGTGVTPNITVPSKDALKAAHLTALETLLKTTTNTATTSRYQWDIDRAKAFYDPWEISEKELLEFVGKYENTQIVVEHGQLFSIRQGNSTKQLLVPLRRNTFMFAADETFKIEFVKNESGEIEKIKEIRLSGRISEQLKTK